MPGKRRSAEVIVAELDTKIAYHNECIASLKAKKDSIINRKSTSRKQIKAQIKDKLNDLDENLQKEVLAFIESKTNK
jgi:hypothetical protein